MKVLTVCQPYATLIASGVKSIENRSWDTRYRGALAIHAGRSRDWRDPDVLRRFGLDETRLPFGQIVAVARLSGCVRRDRLPPHLRDNEHAHGPWCWLLAEVRALRYPVVWKGVQGLSDVPWDIEAQLVSYLA